jgi:iron complex transport system ATP-binding protein
MIKNGTIMADGPCDEAITAENLFRLYNARVNVVKVNGSLRTCVPETVEGPAGQATGANVRIPGNEHRK